jgi:hypothetical protein
MDSKELLSDNAEYIGPKYDRYMPALPGGNVLIAFTKPVPHGYIYNVKRVSIDLDVNATILITEISLMYNGETRIIANIGVTGGKFNHYPEFEYALVEDQQLRIWGNWILAASRALVYVYSEVYKIK